MKQSRNENKANQATQNNNINNTKQTKTKQHKKNEKKKISKRLDVELENSYGSRDFTKRRSARQGVRFRP